MIHRPKQILKVIDKILLMIVTTILLVQPAASQTADKNALERLKDVERAIIQSKKRTQRLEQTTKELGHDIRALRVTVIETAQKTLLQEELVTRIEGELSRYHMEESLKMRELDRRYDAINFTLGTLQRISRVPPEALLGPRSNILDKVRTSILLSAVVPKLNKETTRLKAELTVLGRIRTEISLKKTDLSNANNTMERERIALDRLIKRKADLRGRAIEEANENRQQIAKLAESAGNLRALIDGLKKKRGLIFSPRATPNQTKHTAFSLTRGRLPMPARGIITAHFGQTDKIGAKLKGLVIKTRESARVIAPHDGQIVFAGPFRRYGKLLIIAHGEGYHTLLAGFAAIDGIVGQWLMAGEPVGIMGQTNEGKKPELYLELRQDGEPIDPSLWMSIKKIKVNG